MGRRRYIVAYDITDDRRRSEVARIMLAFGDRVQFSVFYCELNARELVQLRARLSAAVNAADDQVLVIDLGKVTRNFTRGIDSIGQPFAPRPRTQIV